MQFWLDVQAYKAFCYSTCDEINSNAEIPTDEVSVFKMFSIEYKM